MCTLGKIGKKDLIYDLGSGDGAALRVAAKEFSAMGVGVEIDPFRVWTARVLNRIEGLSGQITINRQDFAKTELSEASIIFVYLIPRALLGLEEKFRRELKPGTRVISYIYQIPYLTPVAVDKTEHVYVYKVPPNFVRRSKAQSRS